MKVITVVLAGALLTGCYQSLNQTDVRKAIAYCKGVENIEYIDSYANSDEVVRCLNGDKTYLNRVGL